MVESDARVEDDAVKSDDLRATVAAIEVLQRKAEVIRRLRSRLDAKETPQLDALALRRIVADHTWLLGPRFEMVGTEDPSFTDHIRRIRGTISSRLLPKKDFVSDPSAPCAVDPQTGMFLARRYPTVDSIGREISRCVIVEFPQPSVSLDRRHLRWLEDVADLIKQTPQFDTERMYCDLVVVGRQNSSNDWVVERGLRECSGLGAFGLAEDRPRMKLYVMGWDSLLDSLELTNNFMLKTLKLKRAELERKTKTELIAELQEAH